MAITGNQKEELNALCLARAVVNRVIAELETDNNEYDSLNEAWHVHQPFLEEGWFPGETFPKTTIEYTVVDEESKININIAEAGLLFGLFSQTLPEPTAVSIVECILDWRDADSNPKPEGAEDEYYSTLSPPYQCKNAPFDLLEEILAVKGMTPDLLHNLTVFSKGKINVNTSSEEVLLATGISRNAAKAIIRYRAGSDGVEGSEDDRVFAIMEDVASVPGVTELDYYQLDNFACFKSTHFTITVKVTIGNLRKEITAVLDRSTKPTSILLWRER